MFFRFKGYAADAREGVGVWVYKDFGEGKHAGGLVEFMSNTVEEALAWMESNARAMPSATLAEPEPEPVEKIWRVKMSADVTDGLRTFVFVRAKSSSEAMDIAHYHVSENPVEFGSDAIEWAHMFCGDLKNISSDDAVEVSDDPEAIEKLINPSDEHDETAPA